MNMTPTLRETRELIERICSELKDISEGMNTASQLKNKDRILSCVDQLHDAGDKIDQSIAFMYFGQKSGGQRSTAKKKKAVQENGKKGGRPSKKIITGIRSEENGIFYVEFDDGTKKPGGNSLAEVRESFPPNRYKWAEEAENLYEKLTEGL